MPFQPVPQAVQMDIQYIWDNQECQNSLYFRVPSDAGPGDCVPLGLAVITAFGAGPKSVTGFNCRLVNIHFTDLSDQEGWSRDVPVLPNVAGSAGTDPLPNNCTLAINLSTEVRGKNGRGRIYPPGIVEGAVVANVVQDSWINPWIQFVDDIRSAALDQTWELVVVSRYLNKVKRANGVTYSVTGLSVRDNIVDSQRRRLPGRGR